VKELHKTGSDRRVPRSAICGSMAYGITDLMVGYGPARLIQIHRFQNLLTLEPVK